MSRTSGILLHITSLPTPFGIGDLGPGACRFVDFLQTAGQGVWQVLPLGPTGYGDSPYQPLSVFAGNPLLLSPEMMVADGWLPESELEAPDFPEHRIDYAAVMTWKQALLQRAYGYFQAQASPEQHAAVIAFRTQQQHWLNDYALFAALKARFQSSWTDWGPELVRREPATLAHWRTELATEIALEAFKQFQFFRQWAALRHYAHERGVHLMGDMPLFVAHDSADVWTHQEYFHLDSNGQPTMVAGVPPDYFSTTGQRWGNPLYRWEVLAALDYGFWVERLRLLLSLVDQVRLDHFRGLESYWEISAKEPTAVNGRWVTAPGHELLETLRTTLGELPLIAEDLGFITPPVYALRDAFALPGMAVLQFAFESDGNDLGDSVLLPHNHHHSMVVYTGTHDNDTTVGWWQDRSEAQRAFTCRYLHTHAETIHWDLIRCALASVARLAVIPLPDLLGMGSEARMNRPSLAANNWTWRYTEEALTADLAQRLHELSTLYGRHPYPL